ncbi:MAG: hypothetical protein QXH37_04005, partial [Candidatus Bathyarchaeia archaeon]
ATKKSPPATRKRKVAMAIGVNPSIKAILTTTKELPQKRISISIRKALKRLMALASMTKNLLS